VNARPLLTLLFVAGCAPAAPGEARQAIVGGTPDTGDPAVVMETDNEGGGCTAEVVSPHVVLTAAHCVQGLSSWTITVGTTDIPVTEGHFNPMFDPNGDASYDNGILIVADPLSVTPLPLNRTPLTSAMKGQPVRIIGFGVTKSTTDDYGTRRVANTTLVDYDPQQITVGDAAHAQCDGDSGGPVMMVISGTEVVIGTDSESANDLNGGCAGDLDTRVDVNTSYIDPFIEMHDPGFLSGTPMPDLSQAPVDLATPTPSAIDAGTGSTTGPTTGARMNAGSSGCDMGRGAPGGRLAVLLLVGVALLLRRRVG
jgi:hypothetical protein